DVVAHPLVGVGDIAKALVGVGLAGPVADALLALAALPERRPRNARRLVRERLVVGADGPRAPGGVLEIRPAGAAIAVVDDDVGDGLDPLFQQRDQHPAVLVGAAIAVVEPEVFLWVVADADVAREGGGRQPDQIEAGGGQGGGLIANDVVPALRAE